MPATVFPAPGAGSGSVDWTGYSNSSVVSSSATTVTLASGTTNIGWIGATPVKNSGTGQFANNTVITSVPYTTTFAGSFSGSGQYLTIPSTGTNAAFTFAGNFTVEGWFYPTLITGSDRAIFCLGTETTNRYVWYIRNGGGIASNLFGTGTVTYAVSTPVNAWTHIAVVRSGSTVSVYVNGVVSSTTDTQAGTIGNGVLKIGSDSGGAAVFQGFVSNFRVASVAVYGSGTGAFTGRFNTATTTLTATQLANVNGYPSSTITGTQTSVLTCQSATIIDNGTANSGAGFTISNTGPVTVSSTTIPSLITPGSTFNVNIAPTVTLSSANISIVSNQIHRVNDQSTVAGKLTSSRVYKGLPNSSLPTANNLQKPIAIMRGIPGADYKFDTNTIQKPIQVIRDIPGDGYQFKLITFDRFKLPYTSTQMIESPLSSNLQKQIQVMRDIPGDQFKFNVTPLQKQIAVIKESGQLYNTYKLSNIDSAYWQYFNNTNRIAVGTNNPRLVNYSTVSSKSTSGSNTALTFINPSSSIPSITSGSTYYGTFNGSTQTLTWTSNTRYAVGPGDFTFEAWIRPTVLLQYISSWVVNTTVQTSVGITWFMTAGGFLNWFDNISGVYLTSTVPVPINLWSHVAAVRENGIIKFFINGQQAGSASYPTVIIASFSAYVGSNVGTAATFFTGDISNFRIVNKAVYTGNFTPLGPLGRVQPARLNVSALGGNETLVLTLQDATIIDNSIANNGSAFTITNTGTVTTTLSTATGTVPAIDDYALITDASTNYQALAQINSVTAGTGPNAWSALFQSASNHSLSLGSSASFNFLHTGTGNWTIESWVNFSTLPGTTTQTLISNGAGDTAPVGISVVFGYTNSNNIALRISNGSSVAMMGSAANTITSTNTWYNIAFTFNSATKVLSLYVNGILTPLSVISPFVSTVGFSYSSSNANSVMQIGRTAPPGATNYFNGYVSNLRITRQILYTGNFSLPTGIYTTSSQNAVPTNVALLTFNTSSVTTDVSVNGFTLTGSYASNSNIIVPPIGTAYTFTVPTSSVSNLNTNNTWAYQLWDTEVMPQTNVLTNSSPLTPRDNLYYATLAKGNKYGVQIPSQIYTTLANTFQATSLTKQMEVIKSPGQVPYNHRLADFDQSYWRYFNNTNRIAVGTANPKLINYTTVSSKATSDSNTLLTFTNPSSGIPLITSGPTYYGTFNGTTQYLTAVTPPTPGTITTGPFTIEAWVFPTTLANIPFVVENTYWNTGSNGGWYLSIGVAGALSLGYSTATVSAYSALSSTGAISINVWSHIAVVRDINNFVSFYINGQLANTPTLLSQSLNLNSGGSQSNYNTRVGAHIADGLVSNGFTGNISNVRIIPGTAVYTSSFTPIGPLSRTQIARQNVLALSGTETSFLALQSSSITADTSINNYTLTNIGSVPASTLSTALGTVPRVSDYVLITDTVTTYQALAQISAVSSTTNSYVLTVPTSSVSNLSIGNTWAYQLWEADLLQQSNVVTNTSPQTARERYYYASLARGRYGLSFPYESPATIPSVISVNKVTDTILQSAVSTTLAPTNSRERYYYALLAKGRYGLSFPFESPGEVVDLKSVNKLEQVKFYSNQGGLFESPAVNELSIIDSQYWYDKTNPVDAIVGQANPKFDIVGSTISKTVDGSDSIISFQSNVVVSVYSPLPKSGEYVLITDTKTNFQAIAPTTNITIGGQGGGSTIIVPIGQVLFAGGVATGTGGSTGTIVGNQYQYTWTCPTNVYSVSVVAVGAGAGARVQSGAGGGALAWANNISVTPGQSYTIYTGVGGAAVTDGGNSSFSAGLDSILAGGGLSIPQSGGTYSLSLSKGGGGGGNGGRGADYLVNTNGSGGGGAGGYAGNGGDGGLGLKDTNSGTGGVAGSAGTGGAGGGGGGSGTYGYLGGGGGGVGVLGIGSNGTGGAAGAGAGGSGGAGGGGSGGAGGGIPNAGAYGGGAGGWNGIGGDGAVRIIWPANKLGDGSVVRAFGATVGATVSATDQSGTLSENLSIFNLTIPTSYLTNLNPANTWTVQLWDPEVIPQSLIKTIASPINPRENLYYATYRPNKYGLVYNINSISDAREVVYDKKTDGILIKFKPGTLGQGVVDPTFTPKAPIQFWN